MNNLSIAEPISPSRGLRPARACSAAMAIVQGLLILVSVCGCASTQLSPNSRRFDFNSDTFSYANELVWEYHYDADGKWTSNRREPKPAYSHHCFVVARTARQFFNGVRFDPAQPVVDDATYRRLIREVVSANPRHAIADGDRTVVPGYANLREFSAAHPELLKANCGGKFESYFQRGHWRMIFPLSRKQQEKMSAQLVRHLKGNDPAVIHLARFPSLTINHAMVLFDAHEREAEIQFQAYDPNQPARPTILTYDRATKTFLLPVNDYFPGGRVDVYQVYHRWNY